MKNKLVKSAFILIVASVFSKLLGAIYRVPLTNIIGTVGIGVYQLVFPVYSLLFVLCSNGVCLAISKMVASFRAKMHNYLYNTYIIHRQLYKINKIILCIWFNYCFCLCKSWNACIICIILWILQGENRISRIIFSAACDQL